MPEGKSWYLSKTLWVNIIAIVVLLSKGLLGFDVTAEEAGAILVVVNVVLRAVTKEPLGW